MPVAPPGLVLLSAAQIGRRVRELAAEIDAHYRGKPRPVLLGVMNGALFFLADLVRALDVEAELLCVRLASYRGTASTGRLRGLDLPARAVRGRHILIVDDVLDTGLTLGRLRACLLRLGAAEVRICVLLAKKRRRRVPVRADWIGFAIPDQFVVGYGLDYEGRYRGLKHIQLLRKQRAAYAKRR